MKKGIFLVIALIPVCLFAQQTVIKLIPTTGSANTYALSSISKQTFESGKLVTTFKDSSPTVETTLTELSKVTFGTSVPTALTNEASTTNYSLFPMPVQEDLHLSFEAQTKAQATVQVLSLDGRIVLSNTLTVVHGSNTLNLNVSTLAQGIYICRLSYGDEHYSQQIIKK